MALPPAAGQQQQQQQQQHGLLVQAGPMLKYDTVYEDKYRIFVLISVDDEHSDPSLVPEVVWRMSSQKATATASPSPAADADAVHSAPDQRLYHYSGPAGEITFWRFLLELPMSPTEQTYCTYHISPGHVRPKPDQQPDAVDPTQPYTFAVPARSQNFHWAAYSCNGFSLSVDPNLFNGPSPLWEDLLRYHEENPFHVVNGGGDQIYCDRMVKEPELQAWHNSKNAAERGAMPLTPEIEVGLERFWIKWYTYWFSTGAFSRAIAQIPQTNMLDDHDLIDGAGTYPDEWSLTPIFNHICTRGYWWYLLFQQFLVDEVDGTTEEAHPNKSIIFGEVDAPYFKGFRSHTFLTYLGPEQYLLMLDCRAERKVEQVVSPDTYRKVLTRLHQLPSEVKHLVILLGVPLAYPRMVFVEKILSNSSNPIVMLAKKLNRGFTNSFDERPELLDDLGDHWCAGPHKKERNHLVRELQELAQARGIRISFVSGDVHAGGAGVFSSMTHPDPASDPKYMLAMITSAIVNTPPPPALISILNKLAAIKHRSLFYIGTKETMVGLFEEGLKGQSQHDKYIIGARNWCDISYLPSQGALEFNLRVEKSRGSGQTKSYKALTPAPQWSPTT